MMHVADVACINNNHLQLAGLLLLYKGLSAFCKTRGRS